MNDTIKRELQSLMNCGRLFTTTIIAIVFNKSLINDIGTSTYFKIFVGENIYVCSTIYVCIQKRITKTTIYLIINRSNKSDDLNKLCIAQLKKISKRKQEDDET